MSSYVSLHTHSEYSLLDGLSKAKDLVKKAKDLGMPALAITDHGAMYGAIKFYLVAKDAGVKPIIGIETYQAERSRLDKQSGLDSDQYHLILLAKNYEGYKNLMKLTTISHLEGYYYKPRVDWEVLDKYHEGIICSSACVGGLIGSLVRKKEIKKAEEAACKYREIFGKDHFYLELQHHPGEEEVNEIHAEIGRMSRRLGIPVVATNDSHYTNKDDAEGQETLLCIQTQKTWLDDNRPMSMIKCPDFFFKTPEEMTKNFLDYPDALENTLKIADMVDIEIPMDKYIFTKFPVPDGETQDSYLERLVYERLHNRYSQKTPEIEDRIKLELNILTKMGYASYFLVFQDFVKWALDNGIRRNTRGSAAGSIVSYILGISTLDPLLYKLPFERFMHLSRPTPPDIDLDIADDSREVLIDYVKGRYGEEKVAQIITFGTMEARAAVRDTARALGYPYAVGDRLSKLIPVGSQGFPMTLERAMDMTPELAEAYKNEKETKRIIDLAKKLEGVSRHASVHAAGVIIGDKDLTEYTPLQKDPKGGKIITQYDMYSLDLNASKHAIGLLKMDFLGLRNLTILGQAVKFVRQNRNIEIDLEKIPLDDAGVYEMISAGDTSGVFQLESGGMRKLARELKPSVIFDLGAMVALFRPGPMDIIPEFIKRKRNPEIVEYIHPDLEPILKETYGLIIYQEQVMEMAHKLAGYTMAEADGFRKAMGKKLPELMKKEGEKFKSGMIANGYPPELGDKLFTLIEKFAAYGFNKAHSASYGLVAYHTAYMKYHYPLEYMTAMMTAESRGNTGDSRDEKIQMCIDECLRMKIAVLPPDINKSQVEFSMESGAVRFGLSAIKNVGAAAIEAIIRVRNIGEFTSLSDFARRVDLSKVNKKVLESLIKAGAMDKFGKRAALLAGMEKVVTESHKVAKQVSTGQAGLFLEEEENFDLPDVSEFDEEVKLNYERELLGFFLTEHPARKKLVNLADMVTHDISELSEDLHLGKVVTIGGIILTVRKVMTKKNNEEMAFVSIEGPDKAKIDCVVFPRTFSENRETWQQNVVVIISGKVDNRDEKLGIVVEKVRKI